MDRNKVKTKIQKKISSEWGFSNGCTCSENGYYERWIEDRLFIHLQLLRKKPHQSLAFKTIVGELRTRSSEKHSWYGTLINRNNVVSHFRTVLPPVKVFFLIKKTCFSLCHEKKSPKRALSIRYFWKIKRKTRFLFPTSRSSKTAGQVLRFD